MTPTTPTAEYGNNTPIWWPLRAWLVAEIFFSFMASTATFFRPEDAATKFAWAIPVTVMAATLGVFYAASFPVTIWAATMKRWQDVRVLSVSLGVFAAMMTLMTVLHHDKFLVGTPAYWVWVVSYVLPPFLFGWQYVVHQRKSAPVGTGITHPLPAGVRTYLRWNGVLLMAAGALVFLLPALLVDNAPFKLTPLTARTLANIILGAGLAQFLMAREGDWLRSRLVALLLILIAVLFFVQLGRYPADVRWANGPLLFLLADSILTAALLLWVWLTVGRKGPVTEGAAP